MAYQRFTQFFAPWTYERAPAEPSLAFKHIDERLLDLSRMYSELAQYLSFGPVPGSYQVISFLIRDWDDASTAPAVGDVSPACVLPVECVPVALSVSVIGAVGVDSAQAQLYEGVNPLLFSGVDSAASPPYVTLEGFAVSRFEQGDAIHLQVDTITGAPLAVQGYLWVHQMPKIG